MMFSEGSELDDFRHDTKLLLNNSVVYVPKDALGESNYVSQQLHKFRYFLSGLLVLFLVSSMLKTQLMSTLNEATLYLFGNIFPVLYAVGSAQENPIYYGSFSIQAAVFLGIFLFYIFLKGSYHNLSVLSGSFISLALVKSPKKLNNINIYIVFVCFCLLVFSVYIFSIFVNDIVGYLAIYLYKIPIDNELFYHSCNIIGGFLSGYGYYNSALYNSYKLLPSNNVYVLVIGLKLISYIASLGMVLGVASYVLLNFLPFLKDFTLTGYGFLRLRQELKHLECRQPDNRLHRAGVYGL